MSEEAKNTVPETEQPETAPEEKTAAAAPEQAAAEAATEEDKKKDGGWFNKRETMYYQTIHRKKEYKRWTRYKVSTLVLQILKE